LVGGIQPALVLRDRPGNLSPKTRTDTPALVRHPNAVAISGSEGDRDLHLEISLFDFGLEAVYGRFLRDKVYFGGDALPMLGTLIDICV